MSEIFPMSPCDRSVINLGKLKGLVPGHGLGKVILACTRQAPLTLFFKVASCTILTITIDRESALHKRVREFHSPLLFTPTTLLSKTSSARILNFSRTTPKLPSSSFNLHSRHTNDKNISNFLVRSALKTDHQPCTFQCKTCLFILNTARISRPKAWFPYRCICRVCRTKKIHRTDRIHSISYNKLYLSFLLY